jgi:hypothetical protein
MYLKEVGRIPPMTPTEERRLLALAAQGDTSAENQLVNSLLKFVADIAMQARPEWMARLDALQDANVALLRTLRARPNGDLHAAIRQAIEEQLRNESRAPADARARQRDAIDEAQVIARIDPRRWRRPPEDGGTSVREPRKPRSPSGGGSAHLEIPDGAP